MLSAAKLTVPLTAVPVVVPASVPPPGFAPSATVTLPVKLGTTLPCASCALTSTAGLIAWPATALLGCAVNTSWVAGPGVMSKGALVAASSPVVVALST